MSAERISDVKRGDHFIFSNGAVQIEVTRVAKDGTWADIVCSTGSARWSKRQPLPMPEGVERRIFIREVSR